MSGSSAAAADGSQQKDEGEVKGGQHEQEESSRAQSCVKAKGLSACKSICYIPAHFIRCSVAFKKTNNLMVRSMLYINGDLLGFHEVIPVTKKL